MMMTIIMGHACQREIYYPPPQGHGYNLDRVAPPPPPPLIRHVPAARALPAPQSHFHCGPPPPRVEGILPPPHLPPQQPFCPAPPPSPHFELVFQFEEWKICYVSNFCPVL
ncbi:hypothetical protein DCAR_0935756 [Daucus carota subsp. sativus]|uniref:Uncharacterized protein n=1 Tax=Daucus carota subsp. sativus TaxID=79200 RepID=A0A175YIZ1_DAUCS|nr:hypothetical protein DCAR_0935756 [Daucus carota subsp. sativus]